MSEERYQIGWSVALWLAVGWILTVDAPTLGRLWEGCSIALPVLAQALLLTARWWPVVLTLLATLLAYRPWRGWVNLAGSLWVTLMLLAVVGTFHRGIGSIGE